MKNSIAKKLVLYFAIVLLLFSLVVGGFFIFLFTYQTVQINRRTLLERAEGIAQTLSGFLSGGGPLSAGMSHNHGGVGAYLNLLDEIAMNEIWLVDRDSHQITRGHDAHDEHALLYKELPEDAQSVIQKAFEGENAFSESFSSRLGTQSMTVGAPVKTLDGETIAVVLLHAPLKGIQDALLGGFTLLGISIVVALLAAGALSVSLSLKFIRPLQKMKNTASQLTQGDYFAKTGISQNDELGDLAQSMDVLSERLQQSKAEHDRLDQMRQEFVSNISHELRTPVTVLRVSLEALCDGIVEEKQAQREYHKQMLQDCMHLQRLVDDLLELSRLQSLDFQIGSAPLELGALSQDAVRSMSHIAAKKEVAVNLEPIQTQYRFSGDYGRLRQMLMIILDNAIKFSPVHDIVTVSLTQTEQTLSISITDHGCGIAPEEQPYIFDRFHHTSGGNTQGTGLGLPIARQIALRHNADILVESTAGMTTFSILFPLAQ